MENPVEEEEVEEEVEDEEADEEAEEDNRVDENAANAADAAPARDVIADARTRASLTMVIQPGTEYLRIGRATDPAPTIIPHCIARLWKNGAQQAASILADRNRPPHESEIKERERELIEVERGMKRWSAPTRKAGGGSGDAAEEDITEINPTEHSDSADNNFCDGAPYYVGEDALKVSCSPREDGSAYVFRRPMYRGRLDVVGVSPEVVANDLQTVWEYAISQVIGMPLKSLSNMPCILVLPAHICKHDVKVMVSVLLGRMGFRSCAVLQDAVCTCFHANTLTACVVDIGEGKTSVSVVEDGLAVPCSCVFMGYGGSDIGRLLLALLQPRAAASGELSQATPMDGPESRTRRVLGKLDHNQPAHVEALKRLKERVTYLLAPQQEVMTRSDEIRLIVPGKGAGTLHRLKMGNAACVAPMGLFVPRLFQPLDWQAAQRKAWSDPEEVVDDDFIVEMLQNRPGGGASAQDDRVTLREEHHLPELGVYPLGLHDVIRDCIARVASVHERSDREKEKEKTSTDKGEKGDRGDRGGDKDKPEKPDRDKSIPDKSAKTGSGAEDEGPFEWQGEGKAADSLQRLYANVIIAGGGSEIKGLGEALEARLNKCKPASVAQATVVINPKGRASSNLAWGGGCIAAGVECYRELFVTRDEWLNRGVAVLRERTTFPW